MGEGFLLAIPVYNEEKYVAGVLDEAKTYCQSILVIDDGSTDATPNLLASAEGIKVATHAENRGYGKSLSTAFEFARHHQYEWLITMDCDEQHEASYIPRFVEAAAKGDADIISGTRYPAGYKEGTSAPADRRAINRHITAMLNDRLDFRLTDAFCGFKAYRVESLQHFCVTVPGYAMPMQFWVQVWRASLRVRELAVRLIYHDPTRHFGGYLDDPNVRLAHYIEVFESEMAVCTPPAGAAATGCTPCRSS